MEQLFLKSELVYVSSKDSGFSSWNFTLSILGLVTPEALGGTMNFLTSCIAP